MKGIQRPARTLELRLLSEGPGLHPSSRSRRAGELAAPSHSSPHRDRLSENLTEGGQHEGLPCANGSTVLLMAFAPVVADTVFLGKDLLAWLVLALGGAMAVGNGLALLRPPPKAREGDLPRAPVARSLAMLLIGALAALWALASLVR